jgi:hypothetical protein
VQKAERQRLGQVDTFALRRRRTGDQRITAGERPTEECVLAALAGHEPLFARRAAAFSPPLAAFSRRILGRAVRRWVVPLALGTICALDIAAHASQGALG